MQTNCCGRAAGTNVGGSRGAAASTRNSSFSRFLPTFRSEIRFLVAFAGALMRRRWDGVRTGLCLKAGRLSTVHPLMPSSSFQL